MDRLFAIFLASASAVGLVLQPVAGSEASRSAPDGSPHGRGVAYYCDRLPKVPQAVHVVKIDRSRTDLELHTTLGRKAHIGMSLVSEQIKGVPPEVGEVLAAINGDYFVGDDPFVGDPMGLQIVRGELISAPCLDRVCVYLDADNQPHMTNFVSKFAVTLAKGTSIPVGLNEVCHDRQAVLYTTAAGPTSRNRGKLEFMLTRVDDGPWLPLRIGQTLKARVRQVNPTGNTPTGPNHLVLTLGSRLADDIAVPVPGDILTVSTAIDPPLAEAIMAIGGGPSMVWDGQARIFEGLQPRHPRTAFGWNDKYYFMVVVDGRQVRHSLGMSYQELANYMANTLKCRYGMNLDGGGSAELWFDGRVVSRPSQGGERPNANALVLTRKPIQQTSN